MDDMPASPKVGSLELLLSLMKPVIDNLIPFTLDLIDSIRANRERVLVEGLEKPPKKRSTTKRKPKEVKLSTAAAAAMASLDPETRKFLLSTLKG